MKKFILGVAFLVTLASSTAYTCGLKPLKPLTPLGCTDLVAICTCDSNGQNCRWQWVCQ